MDGSVRWTSDSASRPKRIVKRVLAACAGEATTLAQRRGSSILPLAAAKSKLSLFRKASQVDYPPSPAGSSLNTTHPLSRPSLERRPLFITSVTSRNLSIASKATPTPLRSPVTWEPGFPSSSIFCPAGQRPRSSLPEHTSRPYPTITSL